MKNVILMAAGLLVVIPIIVLIFTVPVWLLWNWLMPELFGLKVITIWQAGGLLILSSLLFKSQSSPSTKS